MRRTSLTSWLRTRGLLWLSVPGVREVRVSLADHFASEEINAGIAGECGFEETFPGEAEGGLDELRRLFQRKAFLARQAGLCSELLAQGRAPESLADMRLLDIPPSSKAEEYLVRRAELGLDVSTDAPLVVDPKGNAIPQNTIARYLRLAQTIQVSIEGNGALCRGLLATRYGMASPEEAHG